MTHALGRFLIRETTISAGSTAEVFYRVFTAGEKAISLSNLQYYGGDSGENLQLFLIPANVMAAGLKPSDAPGSIALTHNGQMNGCWRANGVSLAYDGDPSLLFYRGQHGRLQRCGMGGHDWGL